MSSWSNVMSALFVVYIINALWSIAQLYIPPRCTPGTQNKCLTNSLSSDPERTVLFFMSTKDRPNYEKDLKFLDVWESVNATDTMMKSIEVNIPKKVRQNGTMYMNIFTTPKVTKMTPSEVKDRWMEVIKGSDVTYSIIPLTIHHIPEAKTFNLLGDENETVEQKDTKKTQSNSKPVTHLRSKLTFTMMADEISLGTSSIPPELYYLMRASSKGKSFLPIVYVDELSLRIRDLVIVNKTDEKYPIEVTYEPISFGKLRLFLQFTQSLSSLQQMGFTPKDTDEVKGIFADTNLVLLLVTFAVSAVHMLFDFLAFKNDISFWRSRETMEGLSTSTVLWRAFSQIVVFLYLMDESTSMMVLVPSGVGALIELWKVKKAFKVSVTWNPDSWRPTFTFGAHSAQERSTEEHDLKALKYLSYLLYPLCLGGAIYSLIYTPHKSWYSWTVQSLVNGVYAFGFLFMLPQLFVNYKLKSVAHLPWRAFMYKAFNTFIDDLFAFIITMPTAHRVACFRDDIVFLIYLYQRWLYPVDMSRVDMSGMIDDDPNLPRKQDQGQGQDQAQAQTQEKPKTD